MYNQPREPSKMYNPTTATQTFVIEIRVSNDIHYYLAENEMSATPNISEAKVYYSRAKAQYSASNGSGGTVVHN